MALLSQHSSATERARSHKKRGDLAGYFGILGSEETVQFPSYWTSGTPEAASNPLSPSDPLYQEVLKLVLATFTGHKVGVGFDATGLTHSKLEVQKIWTVENKLNFNHYWLQ